MTEPLDETGLRNWLVDYLVTNIGCSPDDIGFDISMNDLGVGSRDAVVLSGELSELLGRTVSPVDFWQHPTIESLARYLTVGEADAGDEPAHDPVAGSLTEPIAVIGLGCRLPGDISGPDALWQFLQDGGNAVGEVPADRWAPFENGDPRSVAALNGTTRWGSFLSEVDAFDAEFFEISRREAAKMDPQQRLMLEVAWEALEYAGVPPSSLRRSQTGVFVGASIGEYGYLSSSNLPEVDAWSNPGGALSIIANRLSYFLDLRGPSVTVDTACSSSLVAIHLACQSLRTRDADVAIAGGVNLMLSPAVVRGFDQSGALSPTGACHSFDADADGFVRGEGCGAVVLKRLSDAVRDGNRILAVVRGSAVNQDGRSNGLLAPNPAAQMAVLRSAYSNAGVPPLEVDYVETHGTGTLLGDPIEARALGTVLGRGRAADAPLLLGAVKTNMGHLESAAGMVGFIKAVLAVHRAAIPANRNFQTPNPHIPFDQLRLKVVATEQQWPSVARPRRAGVSSFGFGGTNAHVVIEQAPATGRTERKPEPAISTLIVSGGTGERIASAAGALADWMTGDGAAAALADVAHTMNYHRTQHAKFATVCARDAAGAVAGLQALADGRSAAGVVGPYEGSYGQGTVFVYSGQGSHWAGMAQRLLVDEPQFAAAVADLEPVFNQHVGFSLTKILAGREAVSGDAQVQPVLMGLQLALTQLWGHYGVHPDAVIGHSMGEVTAAVVSGALSVTDGLKVIAARSTLMSRQAGQGAVALVSLDAAATRSIIAEYPGVEIAGYLSPKQTVIAGPVAPVDAVTDAVRAQNRFARRVNMEVASHTALMDPILDELTAALADIKPRTPRIAFYSTVFEDAVDTKRLLDAHYWVANVRRPALLQQAITAAAEDHGMFIEVSAHPMLLHSIDETLESVDHHGVGTLWRDGDDTVTFHTNLNATCTSRPPQTPHPAEPHLILPPTPWQHARYWMELAPIGTGPGSGGPGSGDLRSGGPASVRHAPADGPVPPEWLYSMAWPERALTAGEPDLESQWLVVADPDLGAHFGRVLGDPARATVLAPTALADDSEAGQRRLAAAVAGFTHVLFAPALPADRLAAAPGYDVFNAARRLAAALASSSTEPKLFLLTRNAQATEEGDRANPVHALLWGLGRTLALELPEIWGGVIDVDESVPAPVVARYVVEEAQGANTEDQVLYRAGSRRVPRLQPGCALASSPNELSADGCHLVVGATGNIGPYLIRQLADMGAATVVAVSRNPGNRLDELAATLAAKGTTLVTVAADSADASDMAALFERFGNDLPALHGVYLAAFGGGPVTLAEMDDTAVTAMFRPKLDALSVLHELSVAHPVRDFVLFSSISGVTGSRWLAHYTATTTYLDTFAYARRAAGLPATAVNWGLWKSLSDSQSQQEQQVTADSGLVPMADDVAIQALRWVTGPGAAAQSVVASADWDQLAAAYRIRTALHIVDDVEPAGGEPVGSAAESVFRASLREAQPDRRHGLLFDHVRAEVASAMGLTSAQALDPQAGFFQSGMDSLMCVTVQRSLAASLGEALPASVVFDYPTVDALTGHLSTMLPELAEPAEAESSDEYDELSDDELLRRLSERLG